MCNWTEDKVKFFVSEAYAYYQANAKAIEIFCALSIYFILEFILVSSRIYKRGLIAGAAGLFYYNENNKPRKAKQSDKFLKKIAMESRAIKISGATGWETFGSKDSPLYGLLSHCNEAKIILANPNSPDIEERASDVGQTGQQYREEILDSIRLLKVLNNNFQKDIQLKCYNRYPTWKYIILHNHAWVQQYNKRNHVRESTSYAFAGAKKADKDDMIFNHIGNQFLKRWNSNLLGVYNFRTDELDYFDEEGNLLRSERVVVN